MINRLLIVTCAGALLSVGCARTSTSEIDASSAPLLPRIALAEVGDSVLYLEQTTAQTFIARPADTLLVTSGHDAVVHMVRTAPDTLEGFHEYLRFRVESGGQTQTLNTDALLGVRYVLHEHRGRIRTVSAPDLPAAMSQMTDLRRRFEDFFLPLPAQPLETGVEWVDTLRLVNAEGESSSERLTVARFLVRGDTVIEGIAARVIDYEAVIEARMRSVPTTQTTLTSHLTGEEEGSFVYSPERRVMLRRHRIGVLEGDMVVEAPLESHRFPQSYSYESRIQLLPPVAPGGARRRPVQPTEARPVP